MLRTLSASIPHRSGLALVLLLSFARSAHAQSGATAPVNECEVDADCGHGFACEVVLPGAGGQGTGGASTGGTSAGGVAGTAMASGGASDAAAGTGTAGASPGAPVAPPFYCGDMICQTASESPASCPSDCGGGYRYCALATCEEAADCAEGYRCAEPIAQGTGGTTSVPSYCGDGVCFLPENSLTCPEDCTSTGRCEPDATTCYSSADCASGFYCWLGDTSGSGGASTGGASNGGGGGVSGGSETGGTSGSFAPAQSTGGTSAKPATGGSSGMGVPLPASGGTAGVAGASGTAGTSAGTGGAGTGGIPNDPIAGLCMPAGSGGVSGSAGSIGVGGSTNGVGGSAGVAGTMTGGSAGTVEPPVCPGGGCGGQSGAGAGGSGGSGGSTGGSGGTTGGSEASGGSDVPSGGGTKSHDVVTHAGCSVADGRDGSPFAALALLGAVLGLTRRRARRVAPR